MVPFEKRVTQQYLLSQGFSFNAVESDSISTAVVSPSTSSLFGNAQDHAFLEKLVQPGEGVREEAGLRVIGAGKRMGAHYGPVDGLRHVIEESIGSSVLQVGEESADIAGLDRHCASRRFLSHHALAALRAISFLHPG